MNTLLLWLVPVALGMGLAGLMVFLWSLENDQFDDLDGAAARVIHQDDDAPLPTPERGRAGGR